jgi:hypothetical protein
MYLVAIGWLYVALMMSVAEATNVNGSLLGAIVTFLFYGLMPVALVIYLMGSPMRIRATQKREAAAVAAAMEAAQAAARAASAATGSVEPDTGSKPPADAVAPVRKEP